MDRKIGEKMDPTTYAPEEGDVWVSDILGKHALRIDEVSFSSGPEMTGGGRIPYEDSRLESIKKGESGMVIDMYSPIGWQKSFWACPSPEMFAKRAQKGGYILTYRNAPPVGEGLDEFFEQSDRYRAGNTD